MRARHHPSVDCKPPDVMFVSPNGSQSLPPPCLPASELLIGDQGRGLPKLRPICRWSDGISESLDCFARQQPRPDCCSAGWISKCRRSYRRRLPDLRDQIIQVTGCAQVNTHIELTPYQIGQFDHRRGIVICVQFDFCFRFPALEVIVNNPGKQTRATSDVHMNYCRGLPMTTVVSEQVFQCTHVSHVSIVLNGVSLVKIAGRVVDAASQGCVPRDQMIAAFSAEPRCHTADNADVPVSNQHASHSASKLYRPEGQGQSPFPGPSSN